jgi:Protein of unknown function (DUF2997)
MKTIEIIVALNGQTSVQTKGFTGTECRLASEFIETALGRQSHEQLTNDFYAYESEPQRLQEGT